MDTDSIQSGASPKEEEKTRRGWKATAKQYWIMPFLFALIAQPFVERINNALASAFGHIFTKTMDGFYAAAVEVPAQIFFLHFAGMAMSGFASAFISIIIMYYIVKSKRGRAKMASITHSGRLNDCLNCIAVLGTLVWCSVLYSGMHVSYSANATYQRRVMVLSAVVSDQEQKELNALWGSMATEAHYEHVMEKMDGLAQHYSISLPPRRI